MLGIKQFHTEKTGWEECIGWDLHRDLFWTDHNWQNELRFTFLFVSSSAESFFRYFCDVCDLRSDCDDVLLFVSSSKLVKIIIAQEMIKKLFAQPTIIGLTDDAWVSGPVRPPQKFLLSQNFRHLMGWRNMQKKICLPCLVPEISLFKNVFVVLQYYHYYCRYMRNSKWSHRNSWSCSNCAFNAGSHWFLIV